jgi:uncharacterized membrane protein
MGLLSPLHPRFVHFPIALLLTGVVLIALALTLRRERWLEYGRFSLFLGWLGVLVASLTGLIDEARAPDSAPVQAVVNQHITVGILLLVIFGLALYWPLRNPALWGGLPTGGAAATEPAPSRARRSRQVGRQAAGAQALRAQRWLYLALLLLGAALIVLEGWLGGKLVYTFGVGVLGH